MENIPDVKARASSIGVSYVFLISYLVGLSAFGSFVNDMYLPSLPAMCKFFGCSVSMVQLGLTTGMIGLGLGQIIMGPVSDKYGRKPVLLWSLALFIVAAVVSVFSPTIIFFLVLRFFQGAGASGGYFLARTIPTDIYSGRALAKIMAVVGAINGFAPASAPALGGVVSHFWDWQGVFWVLAALAAVLMCFGFRLKESLPPSRRDKGSLADAFKAYGIMVKRPRFVIHVLLKGAGLGVLFAYMASAPFIMESHFGYSETVFGLIMGGNALAAAAGSMTALRFKILKKSGLVAGILLFLSTVAEAAVLFFCDNFYAYEFLLLPMLFSLGMIFTVGNTLAMNEGRDNAGVSSAVLGVTGYIFGAIVSPLVGKGDIMHSSAIVLLSVAFVTLLFSIISARLVIDIDMAPGAKKEDILRAREKASSAQSNERPAQS